MKVSMASRWLAVWCACVGTGTLPAALAAEPIPVATFVGFPETSDVRLSPSGRFIALSVANKSGRTILAVTDVDLSKPPVVVAASARADIASFEWVNDDWLVYNVVDLQTPMRQQEFGPGLFSVRRDGSAARQLIRVQWDEFTTGTNIVSSLLDPSHRLTRVLRDGSSEVIVGQYHFSNLGELISVTPKRLDVSTGRAAIAVLGYPEHTVGWVFDAKGVARVAETLHDGWVEIFWRDSEAAAWRSLMRANELQLPWSPLALDGEGRLYLTVPSSAGTEVLKRFDFATNAPEAEALASAPGFDLEGGLVFTDRRDRLLGLRVLTDAETTVWFDPERKKLQALADAKFVGRVNRITCSDRCDDDAAMLVYSYSDHDPGVFSLYHLKTQTWTTVGSVRSGIDPRQMADLDMHRIKARDGLELPVWVTRPRLPKGPLPAVLLVHGGPWVRGVQWGWHGEAQLLASRGYVVIEPEFRGSTGYGRRLFRAGFKNWGTTMQDDLADVVAWAADQGIADAKRVCIVGASYGGYAALMAPIRYPELFKCSVAWVAVSDPRLMFEESWQNDIDSQAHFSMRIMIGDPVRDAALLKAAAPVERAAELKIPVLMAYGSDDVRVPLEHGAKMRAAMRAAGHEPEYVVYQGEGHGFLKLENRVDFYTRMEKFLAKHIGN
jgi:dipeptidyl aminopeptidase/acylaminoacyl peptidase